MDLGIGDPGVVIEHGMDERGPSQRVPEVAVGQAGAARRHGAVGQALGLAHEPSPAAVRNIAQFLDIDMQQGAGVGVLVTADRLAGHPVHVGQAADPAPGEDLMDRGGATPTTAAIGTGPRRCFHRRCTILRTTGCGVAFGEQCGRDEASAIPAAPSWR